MKPAPSITTACDAAGACSLKNDSGTSKVIAGGQVSPDDEFPVVRGSLIDINRISELTTTG
jgi:hypothetical protein